MNFKNKIIYFIPVLAIFIWFYFPAKTQAARYQYTPTGGNLVLGTELNANTATSTDAQGTNLGSWRGTLADDNLHWTASSTSTGINMQLHVDGVELNNSNKMLIQTEVDLDATVPSLKFQICDWVNATDVNAVADAQCTGGGWRSLNTKNNAGTDINYTDTASDQLQWHIYNGYWATTTPAGGAAINTPLSNFVKGDSTKRVLIRYFSTTNTTSRVDIDFLRVTTIIDSVYWPAGFVNLASSTPTGYYVNAQGVGNSATAQLTMTTSVGSDGIYISATGTVSQKPSFYLEFKDVRTYTGMNAFMVRGEFGCSTTGINVAPYIYNFNSSSWEALTTATIACSATDTVGAWAKGNININHYLSTGSSGGTMRVKLEGSGNSATIGVRWDYVFVMVGSVNADTSQCEITMGTGTATNCQYTRDMDTSTSTPAVFANPAEDESAAAGTGVSNSVYYTDVDHDATVEESTSSNIDLPATLSSNMQVAGIHYAARFAAGTNGATALTVQPTIKDYRGLTAAVGGWVLVGTTSANATQVLTDSLTTMTTALYGYQNNPNTFVNTVTNKMNMRLRPTADGTAATNTTTNWDFAMMSLQWIESNQPTKTFQFLPTGGNLALGTEFNANTATTTTAEGTNLGSWRGTLTDDNTHWAASSTSSGIDMQLYVDNVELNNANMVLIQTEVDNDTSMTMKFQICDWVSSTDVNNVADSNCTGGGWRTLNSKTVTNTDVNFTATAGTALQWHIYNGYWATSTGASLASIDTPLSNFVKGDSTKRVLIRYFSTANTTQPVAVDFLRVMALTDSIYHPGGFTNLGSGVASGTYVSTIVVGNTASAQQSVTTADAQYFEVPGTAGSVADFYWSFKNVKTYTGMNTIYVKADYACHTTGINHRPKIYNFASSTWEDLTTANIACATADATASWAKNNVNINDYLSTGASGGEIRVGWRGLSNGTQRLRFDYVYIIVGTTNTDSSDCQVTLGTGTATDCANARNIDQTGTNSYFVNFAEDESATAGTGEANSIYAFDTTHSTTVEEGVSSNINFAVTMPSNAMPASVHFALRYDGGINSTNPDMLVTPALKDYAGYNATQVGGWVTIGSVSTTGATTTSDSITALSITAYGVLNNPEDSIDTYNNKMNIRLRTSTSGASSVNNRSLWDFALVSLAWVDLTTPPASTITVSGVVYGINETTPLVSATPIKLAVGGSTGYSATSTAVTGAFSFSSVTQPSNGNILTLWLNTDGGDQASLVFDYGAGCSGGNCSGLSLYKNRVVIDSKNGSTLTNTSLAGCDNLNGSACTDTDIGFIATTSQLTLTWPINTLRLATTTSSFSPGGNITAGTFDQSAGSFNGGSGMLTFDGSFSLSGGVATSTSGSLRVANDITRSGSGKFNHNNGEVVLLSPWLTTTISGMGTSTTGAFYDLRIDIPDKTVKVTAGENLLIANHLVLTGQPGSINKMMSTVPADKWYIKLLNTSFVNFAGIADAGCALGSNNPFTTPETRDFGNNGFCWQFIKFGGGGGGNAGAPPPPPPDDPLGGGGGGNQQGGGGFGGGGGGGGGNPPPCPPDDLQCQGGGGGGGQTGGSEGGGGGGAAP